MAYSALITAGTAVASTAVAQQSPSEQSIAPLDLYNQASRAGLPFLHSVASGDPLPDSVILWTRVTPDRDSLPGSGLGPDVTVRWDIATDTGFGDIVGTGTAVATAEHDHTVHIDVTGLAPDSIYYYRFIVLDGEHRGATSPIGRTKTAPAYDSSPDSITFATASCANWECGYFSAYRDMAQRGYSGELDLVVFLGDYIYEYATGEYAGKSGISRPHHPQWEITTLEDYRIRYGTYRTDPFLQAAHASTPWVVTWDDHETANNSYATGAENHTDNPAEGIWGTRRDNAQRAYFEWLPVRVTMDSPEKHIYRSFQYGDGNWNFLLFGDPQIGVNTKIDEQKKMWMQTVDTALADVPDAAMLVSVGDQVEGWGSPLDQHRALLEAPQVTSLPLSTIPGNHETYSGAMEYYKSFFTHPNQEEDIQDYYYEKNNVLFIGLDTNNTNWPRHEEFLRATVKEHGDANDWIVVMLHQAPFSQGSHVHDNDVTGVRTVLAPVFSDLGVDAVLSGHDHIYTRSHLMEGDKPVIAPAIRGDRLEPADGQVLYLTATSTGAGKYYDFHDKNGVKVPNARMEHVDDFNHPAYEWTAFWRQDYDPDYTKVEVSPQELTFTTYDADTPYVIDKVTIANNEAPKPEKPTTLSKPTTTKTTTNTVTSTNTTTTTNTSTSTTTVTEEPLAAGSSEGAATASIVVSVLGVLGALGVLLYDAFGPQLNQLLGR